jgi:hypothetical protein
MPDVAGAWGFGFYFNNIWLEREQRALGCSRTWSPRRDANEEPATPFLFFHSSICFALASASFFAYSIGIFFPWYACRMGRTSSGLYMAMAGMC